MGVVSGAIGTGSALLDTSVVIALTQEGLDIDVSGFERLMVSSVTYSELRLGIACARDAETAMTRSTALEEISSLFGEGLPFDDAAAQHYGRILQTVVRRRGQPRAHTGDRMIAAIAASHGLPLLTLNGGDLNGLDAHLRVIDLGAV
ncbi:MAG: PIN domain-containing protein [Leucobacter sp.]